MRPGRARAARRTHLRRTGRGCDRGSSTIELAILAPALLALLGMVIVAGRLAVASSAVEQAASAAARAATLARDARAAQAEAERTAQASMEQQGITCDPLVSRVDTSGFAIAVGQPASVSVRVLCGVPLGDLAVPGVPGVRRVTAEVTSPLDRFRGRG